jgi:hypothetical protein
MDHDRDETKTDGQTKGQIDVTDKESPLEATTANKEPNDKEPKEYRGMIRQMGDMLKDTINTVTGPDGDLGGDQTRPIQPEPEATKPSST